MTGDDERLRTSALLALVRRAQRYARDQPLWKVPLVDDRSAALLIRVWLEDGGDEFRARLTTVGGPPGDDPVDDVTVAVASSARDVVDAVSEWLDGFLRNSTDVD